jgi:hypothetical protein
MRELIVLALFSVIASGCGDNLRATPDAGVEAIARCGAAPVRPEVPWRYSNLCVPRDVAWLELDAYRAWRRAEQAMDWWVACVEER